MSIATVPELSHESVSPDFEEIYRQYAPLVYRTARAVTGSPEDAEDVLQTIFLKLIRQEFPPDLKNNPQAYLYRAAVNASLNIVRRRRREVLVEDSGPFDVPAPADTDNEDPELQRLYEGLSQLKPDAAEILILRYMHSKGLAEIARELGVSRTAVAVRLFRSRARLKALLRETPENSHATR